MRRSPLIAASLCTAALALLLPASARAQGATKQAAAQALFEEGRTLIAAGNYAEACPKFRASNDLDPGAGTLLNLAVCYEKGGQLASAWAAYHEAASSAETSGRTAWVEKARARIAAIEPKLSRVTVVVPVEPPDLTVKLGATPVTRDLSGVPVPVDAGSHVLEASAPGHEPWRTTVTVEIGRSLRVTVPALRRVATSGGSGSSSSNQALPAPEPGVDPASSSSSPLRTIGIIGIAAGGVAVAVGGAFGLKALGSRNDAADHCNDALSLCTSEGAASMSDARDAATLSTIGFVAGGALLAGGLVLVLVAPSRSRTAAWRPVGLGTTW